MLQRNEIETLLECTDELGQAYDVLRRDSDRWARGQAIERAAESMGRLLEFLQRRDVVAELDELLATAYRELTATPTRANELLMEMQRRHRTVVRDEIEILGRRITAEEIIEAIRAYARLRAGAGTFAASVATLTDEFSAVVVAVRDEIVATRGMKSRRRKDLRRRRAVAALQVAVRGVSLLVGNGLAPATYLYSYALGNGSLRYAHQSLQ